MKKGSFVDNDIEAAEGAWEFNAQVAASFDSHARRSIPFYDEIQRMLVEMAREHLDTGDLVYDLGSATGETVLQLQNNFPQTNLRFVGIENSQAMIDIASEKCSKHQTLFRKDDLATLDNLIDAKLVVSMCTLQFLSIEARNRLVGTIYRDLLPGGAFLIVEKVKSDSAVINEHWRKHYHAFKRSKGLTDEMIAQKERSLEGVLVPQTFDENQSMFARAGFREIQPFFCWYNFVGWLAVKGAGTP